MLNITKMKSGLILTALIFSFSWSIQTRAQSTDDNSVKDTVTVQHVTALEASEIIKNDPDIVILDVRTPVEFKLGRLEHAVNINYYSFSFKNQIAKLDRSKTYLVHCQSGVRSGNTMPIMLEAGFTNLIHMDGGYADWKRSKLPIK